MKNKKVKFVKVDGNKPNCKRDLHFESGTILEEVCTFAQENGHGYTITGGDKGMDMANHCGQFVAYRIPGDSSKCIISFSATWQASDPAKGQKAMEGMFKLWGMLFEKLLPEKINGTG